jgi:hypothetical protein
MPSKSLIASSLVGATVQHCDLRESFSKLLGETGHNNHRKLLAYNMRNHELEVAMAEATAQGRPRSNYLGSAESRFASDTFRRPAGTRVMGGRA